MTFPDGETVTLVRRTRAPDPDQFGNDVYTTTQTDITGCVVWPRGSSEVPQGQDTVTSGLTVLLPPATAVEAVDAVIVHGDRYEIDGEPAIYHSPFTGRDPGVEINLTRITG